MKINIFILLTLLFSGVSCTKKIQRDKNEYTTLNSKAILRNGNGIFTEEINIYSEKISGIILSRNLDLKPLNFLTRQQIKDVSVKDSKGQNLKFRVRHYMNWGNIDFLEIPGDGKLFLNYTILGFADFHKSLSFDIVGIQWNIAIKKIHFEMQFPQEIHQEKTQAIIDYQEDKKGRFIIDGNTLIYEYKGTLKPKTPVNIRLEMKKPLPQENRYKTDLKEIIQQNKIVIIFAVFFLFMSLIFIFLPADIVHKCTFLMNFLIIVPAAVITFPGILYWIHESKIRGGDWGNVISDIAFFAGFLFILVGFIIKLNRDLLGYKKSAWYMQLAMGAVLFTLIPIPHSSAILLPLMGYSQLLYWLRRDISFKFGIGLNRISEYVWNEGEVGFDDISKKFSMSKKNVTNLLEKNRNLPFIIDYSTSTAMSPENASLKNNMIVCPYCSGAGTISGGAGKLECVYCGREFHSSLKEEKRPKPVPVLIEAIATVFLSLGFSIGGFGLFLSLIFFFLGIIDGDGVTSSLTLSLVTAAIFSGINYLFYIFSGSLKKGQSLSVLKVILVVTAPLIIPLIALFKLGNKRVKLHFGEISDDEIKKEITNRGQMTVDEFSKWLGCSIDEATDVILYLTGNALIDAVFDRKTGSLVSRELYRKIATEGECINCGGLYGFRDGALICQYCGHKPE
ncbi:MAG: hypothetical protein JXR95_02385 [Deltaproteobacteria bacterium]|nr:hypothetical protein [Deltaproteobacteria bacterium]